MFFSVVILVFATNCCTARVIDVSDKHSAWESRGKLDGDIVLTEEQLRNGLINSTNGWPNKTVPFVADDVFNVSDKQSAWERSGKFGGDIMLTEEQMRNGLTQPASRWPDRRVPFLLEAVFRDHERREILQAFDDFERNTPVRFRPFNPWNDMDFVHITGENSGCWSFVGRVGGRQQLNLQPNLCTWPGIIKHELMHALGFLHEHSRTDRDNYVVIHWSNIQRGREHNFNSYPPSVINNFSLPYDYSSIMHYGTHAFTLNGQPTIWPRDRSATIGQTDGFSDRDIEKVVRMYGVNSSYATRSQFITLITVIVHVLTQLQ